ncbi:hypothetical protein PMI42_04156 [Bradyrhizobium sp. YR681]|uniref:hypothetical protein n=1 Tax=Bradyrhizobium sp. YR681 TaxID=1144344 RepID=UPI000270FDDD|nr:hypothetical protein [Bradyrhizobium sp. YR681]EJN12498.1 hypothetical protein PMI42_04156 [Bradyrhizobium sp. YR681]
MADIDLASEMACRNRADGITNSWVETISVAVIASAVSVLHTGFVFGIINNQYHLPIVAGLYNEPQYHDDAFIQSLRYFASGVWLVLSGIEKHFDNIPLLFFILFFLSRVLCFVGFLCCASLLGITERRDKIVFSLIVCFVGLLNGYSYAGTGGLFINYFTHSEIANGTALLAIYLAARGRFAAAAAMVGVTFFINAFFAVWLVLPLILIGISLLLQRKVTVREFLLRTLAGLVLCVPLAAVVLYGFFSNPEFGSPPVFDYATFLRQYFPGHVLIDSTQMGDLLALLGVTIVGAAGLLWFGRSATPLQAAYLGAILVYVIGIGVPFVTASPVVLNLHLLRSGTVIHLLAGLAMAALATDWLRRDKEGTFLPACLIVLFLSFDDLASLASVLLILAFVFLKVGPGLAPAYQRTMGYLVLATAVIAVWPLSTWYNVKFNRLYTDAVEEWTDVGNWARNATPSTSMFLVPNTPKFDPASESSAADIALSRAVVFEFVSHRRIWVDFRRGGSSALTPSYYRTWRSRLTEVEGLNSLAERMAYASRNGIGYIVDICQSPEEGGGALYRTKRLCVYSTEASRPSMRKDASAAVRSSG